MIRSCRPVLRELSILAVVATCVVFLTTPVLGQRTGGFTFDSGSCHEDTEETIYITLLGNAFRLPMDYLLGFTVLRASYLPMLPPGRNPTEPFGCPSNPLPGDVFRIAIPRPPDMVFPPPRTDRIRVPDIALPVFRLRIRSARPDFFGLQSSHLRDASSDCAGGEVRWLGPHLRECLVYPGDDHRTRESWGGSYIADPDNHSIPFQEFERQTELPFVVSCLPSIGVRNCLVSYKIYRTVNIDYRIDIRFIDPAQVVDIDRVIRETLENWRVSTTAPSLP